MCMKMQIRKEYFLLVVKENAEIFYRYAYSVLLNRQDAEDAVSETILKAFEHLNDLKHLHKMKSWMFQILANNCKTMLSKKLPVSDAIDAHTELSQNQEAYMDLHDCIYHMEPKFREVIILFYFGDFKIREIAKILNISEGTVKSRLSRAKDKLKKLFV